MSLLKRLRNLGKKDALDRNLDDELRSHLEMRANDSAASGMSPEDARYDAQKRFGNATLMKERTRDADILAWLESIGQDLVYAARSLRKNPGFTAVAVLTLALGMGANTAIFTAVDRVLLRPLPYAHEERLVALWEDFSFIGFPRNNLSPADFADWKKTNSVFEDMAAVRYRTADLTTDGPPEMVLGRGVTANFFQVLGISPALGRTFTDEEDKSESPIVLISSNLWRRRFGGDSGVIGRSIAMNGNKVTIIGVMPEGFSSLNRSTEFWVPARFTPQDMANRGSHFLNVVARLKPGITIETAQSEMATIAKRLETQFPSTNMRVGAVVRPLREEIVGNVRLPLAILMAAAVCVLLIACSNLSNLLVARSVGRRRELAVRAGLGATKKRLIRQLLTESLLLSTLGGILGLLFARWGAAVLGNLVPPGMPASTPGLDLRMLGFTSAVVIGTGILFGLRPALQGANTSLSEVLKESGRTGMTGNAKMTGNALVVSEVALAFMLLLGAGLLLETLARIRSLDAGFRSDHILTMDVRLSRKKYSTDSMRVSFFENVQGRLRGFPGVQGAGFASDLPFTSTGDTEGFRIEGRPKPPSDAELDALYREVTNDYLQTIGARLLDGRLFGAQDGASSMRVVIINQTFAKGFWGGESPIGKRIQVGTPGLETPWRTIVGVVADVHERGMLLEMKPAVYLPVIQVSAPDPEYLAIRTTGDPLALLNGVRQAIWAVDPEQPISDVRTMQSRMDEEIGNRRQAMVLLGTFAGLAVFLASLGIYGVLSYSVSQRTKEIGIRMALGAQHRQVLIQMLKQGATLAALGLTLGIALSLALGRLMAGLLFGIQPTDLRTFIAVSLLLATIVLFAIFVPARRATRVDVIVALRHE